MRRLIFLWAMLWGWSVVANNASAQSVFDGQVLSAADLSAAGVSRLSNIFILVDGARITTIDGFTVSPSFNSLSPLQERSWSVFVDGQMVDAGMLDVQALDALSIPISSIDRVVVKDTPSILHGDLQRGGTVEIWTREAEANYHVRASISAGNESGDPGPFRYVRPELRFANVDKDGPDGAIDVGLSRASDGVESTIAAGAVVRQAIPSDAAVFRRNLRSFDVSRTPEMRVVAPFVSGTLRNASLIARLRVSGSAFDDMFFTREIAREIPTHATRIGATASVSSTEDRNRQWQLNASYSRRDAANFASASRHPLDWHEQSARTSIEVSSGYKGIRVMTGVSGSFLSARSDLGIDGVESIVTGKLYGRLNGMLRGVNFQADSFVGRNETGNGAGVTIRGERALVEGQLVGATATIAQLLPTETNPVAFWIVRGLDLSPTSDLVGGESDGNPRLGTVDALWRWSPTDNSDLTVSAAGRRFGGFKYSSRQLESDGEGFKVASSEIGNAWGSTTNAKARFDVRSRFGDYTAMLSYQTVLSGNSLFYEAFDSVGRRQIRLSSTHRAGGAFSIRNTLYHYSGSRWAEYRSVEETSDYEANVPGLFRWDLAAYKGLMQNRIQFSFVIENLLNDRVGFHPIGATFDRTLRVQLAVDLD